MSISSEKMSDLPNALPLHRLAMALGLDLLILTDGRGLIAPQ